MYCVAFRTKFADSQRQKRITKDATFVVVSVNICSDILKKMKRDSNFFESEFFNKKHQLGTHFQQTKEIISDNSLYPADLSYIS